MSKKKGKYMSEKDKKPELKPEIEKAPMIEKQTKLKEGICKECGGELKAYSSKNYPHFLKVIYYKCLKCGRNVSRQKYVEERQFLL